jgi:hypothetical protein
MFARVRIVEAAEGFGCGSAEDEVAPSRFVRDLRASGIPVPVYGTSAFAACCATCLASDGSQNPCRTSLLLSLATLAR